MPDDSFQISEPVGVGVSSLKGHRPIQNLDGDVRRVQQALIDAGEANGGAPAGEITVTGQMDAATVKAIRRFQQRQLGFQDGVIDPGSKTEARFRVVLNGKQPDPPEVAKTQDIVIHVLGQDPRAADAGKRIENSPGQTAVGVQSVADFNKQVETPDYLANHGSLIHEHFNGGRNGTDPTDAVTDFITDQIGQLTSKNFRHLILIGMSSGGRNVLTIAQKLSAKGILISYFGSIDAAFDSVDDGARGSTVLATFSENFFQTLGNDLIPGDEFHGRAIGVMNNVSFDQDPEFQKEKDSFDTKRKFLPKAAQGRIIVGFRDKVHTMAVQKGYRVAKQRALNLLVP